MYWARGSSLTRTEAIAPQLAAPRSNVSKLLDSLHIGHYWEILHNFLTIGFNKRGGTFWNSSLWRWLCVRLDFWKIVCWLNKGIWPFSVVIQWKMKNCCCMMATDWVSYADFFKTFIMLLVKNFKFYCKRFIYRN